MSIKYNTTLPPKADFSEEIFANVSEASLLTDQILPPDPRDRQKYFFHETRFRRFAVAVIRFGFWFIGKRSYTGVENLPVEGPVVLVANHLTNFDVFPMQFGLPRTLFFMAKSELHENPLLDAFLRYCGAFPVFRGEKDQWAIRHAERVLEHGQVLAIFPEGTRSKGRGLRAAKTGAARLALHAQCPIVPVAVTGTHQMFTHFPHRTHIAITVGAPLTPEPHESALALTDRIMFTIAAMLPPELRGVYAEHPTGFD